MNKVRFTNCNCHCNCETQIWICNTCENVKDSKYEKLLEFVKKLSAPKQLPAYNILPFQVSNFLKEIGET